jgi:hypothetical protein
LGLFVAGALSGCTPTNFIAPPADKTAAKPVEPIARSPRPPVTAAQINSDNAHEKEKELRDELDRDWERAIEANDVKPEKK